MLETKIFEIRDRATFFVVYATRWSFRQYVDMDIETSERYLLQRDGFQIIDGVPFVLMARSDGRSSYDPYSWGDRTHGVAHKHIADNWFELQSGDVIDVEFILGETAAPKVSERFTAGL